MQITKKSPFSGKTNTREIDVSVIQLTAWHEGEMIQVAMPHLSPDDREFLMTGITPEEWDDTFGPEEDEEQTEKTNRINRGLSGNEEY